MQVLEAHPWPGNVRELENTIQRAVVLASGDLVLAKDLPVGASAPDTPTGAGGVATTEQAIDILLNAAQADPSVQLLPWLEREFTLHAMKATRGNQLRAAKLLGMTRATLRKRLERFGITKELTIS